MPKLKIVGLPLVLEPTWSCSCGRHGPDWWFCWDLEELEELQITSLLGFSLEEEIQIKVYKSRENWILGLQKLCLACLAFLINIDSAKWISQHVTLYFLATGGTCVCIYIAAVYTTNNHPRLLGFSNVNTSSPLLTTICWPLCPPEPPAHSTRRPVHQDPRLK